MQQDLYACTYLHAAMLDAAACRPRRAARGRRRLPSAAALPLLLAAALLPKCHAFTPAAACSIRTMRACMLMHESLRPASRATMHAQHLCQQRQHRSHCGASTLYTLLIVVGGIWHAYGRVSRACIYGATCVPRIGCATLESLHPAAFSAAC